MAFRLEQKQRGPAASWTTWRCLVQILWHQGLHVRVGCAEGYFDVRILLFSGPKSRKALLSIRRKSNNKFGQDSKSLQGLVMNQRRTYTESGTFDEVGKHPIVSPLDKWMSRIGPTLVADQLKHANLLRAGKPESTAPDCLFHSNDEFWERLLNGARVPMKWLTLKRFQIVDWFPRAPGLFHSEEGRNARYKCGGLVFEKDLGWFYQPQDKCHLIEGGIGAIRFRPMKVDGVESCLCTATSDGTCHSGVPIAVPDELLARIDFDGNHYYDIVGQSDSYRLSSKSCFLTGFGFHRFCSQWNRLLPWTRATQLILRR